jgi:hypothetical protein
MYGVLVGALLLFPWSLAIYIALGAFYAARRKCIAGKGFKKDE